MDAGFLLALALALGFAFTNGVHDASNAIATLVATRAATPMQAALLAAAFNFLGPLVAGAAVADTVGGFVTLPPGEAVDAIGAGLAAAVAWNALTWALGLPSSSGHALVGGLVGAALLAGGVDGVHWTAGASGHSIGVLGTLAGLALSPLLGAIAAFAAIGALRRAARRTTNRWKAPVRAAQWAMSGALAFSHGANDAAKSVGVVAALLLADGRIDELSAPVWVTVACSAALTAGTALGGWRVVRTVGRRIYPIRSLDALASQTASSTVIFGATLLGAPVSTTQVVASSVVGAGTGRQRWHHVRWAVVRNMGVAWIVTVPATAALGACALSAWRAAA
jgi:PiT family inorganic phosphate transporter